MRSQLFNAGAIVLSVMFTLSCTGNSGSATALDNSAVPAISPSPTPSLSPTPSVAEERKLDVPYVPTPQNIVDEMLAMAGVTGKDILWDLGSGDGRIPITAAKRFGTRGNGVDLDPERISEANENAKKAGVADKVSFIAGDLFETDFSEATVVTLYLLPDVNLKLKPKLLAMKPGTRIVSHNYDMGDWAPEKSKNIKTPDGTDHYVYFWRVPERSAEK